MNRLYFGGRFTVCSFGCCGMRGISDNVNIFDDTDLLLVDGATVNSVGRKVDNFGWKKND